MFKHPVLAKCSDRTSMPKANPMIGGPEQWLAPHILSSFGFVGFSFDFFIDWKSDKCQDEIWIKRISDTDVHSLSGMDLTSITAELSRLGDNLAELNKFTNAFKLDAYYQIFRGSVDWCSSPEDILKADILNGSLKSVKTQSLNDIMSSIQTLSGGPVRVGSKGLIYGTSSLECFLSKTDALWPGDVDCILWQPTTQSIIAILEFKKHTLDTPISQQKLSNYYPQPDERKYKRLALLRDRLDKNIPLVVVYYPTNPLLIEIKLELIAGKYTQLESEKTCLINYRGKTVGNLGNEVVSAIIDMTEGSKL